MQAQTRRTEIFDQLTNARQVRRNYRVNGKWKTRSWAPIRTFRSTGESASHAAHGYSPQTWTRPAETILRQHPTRSRDSRCTKRGTPATGQPVREFESRPLRRINRIRLPGFDPSSGCDRPLSGSQPQLQCGEARLLRKLQHAQEGLEFLIAPQCWRKGSVSISGRRLSCCW